MYTECTDKDSQFHTSIPSVQIGTRKVGGALPTITLQIRSHSGSPLIVLKLYRLMLCELVAGKTKIETERHNKECAHERNIRGHRTTLKNVC